MTSALYFRADGLTTVGVDLTSNRDSVRRVIECLLTSRLHWFWISEPRHPASSPPVPFRAFGTEAADDLLSDFMRRDEDGYGNFVLLVGLGACSSVAPELVRIELARFVRGEPSPAAVVIHQLGDSEDFVTVRVAPAPEVGGLLSCLGIDLASIQVRRPYERLGVAALDSVASQL